MSSYFLSGIKFYPNIINHYKGFSVGDRDKALNYNPSSEPTITDGSATVTSSGGETSGARYDIVDNKIGSVVNIDNSGTSLALTIHFDLLTARNVDTVILANHNLFDVTDGSQVDLKIIHTASTKASMSSATDGVPVDSGGYSPTNDYTITSNEAQIVHGSNNNKVFKCDITKVSSVFWSVVITSAPATTWTVDFEIGEVSLCEKWAAPHAPETEGWQDLLSYNSLIEQSRGGQKYSTFYSGERKRITLAWTHLTTSEMDGLEDVFRNTKGSTYPLWVDLGEHATLPYLRYMRLVGDFTRTPLAGGLAWNTTITLEEEL